MAVIIASQNNTQNFNKRIINIGSTPDCDFKIDIGEPFILTLQYLEEENKCILLNRFNCQRVMVKDKVLGARSLIKSACKISISGSSDFIAIKIVPNEQVVKEEAPIEDISVPIQEEIEYSAATQAINTPQPQPTAQAYTAEVKSVNNSQPLTQKEILENQKAEIERKRTSVVKQVGFAINDIKKRISLNNKASIFVHIAMLVSSFVTAFGVSNYLTGLKIEETKNFINLPTNIKILCLFTVLIFGLCLILKQGVFLYYQNKTYPTPQSKSAQNFMLTCSSVFFAGIYIINVIYYLSFNPIFSILISLFFVGLSVILAAASGYFKSTGHMMSYELDKHEYREDFEAITNEYRSWIDRYVNSISQTKLENVKDKLFNLQIKSVGETILGVITAPFLAYGVSNTLAMCFPEAAGWIRISGLRFSPIFLILASFLIIFAFFAFVNVFLSIRKIQGSNVIKLDGFSNYLLHGTDILGIQAVQKLDSEKLRSLIIGCSIVVIEFTMNTSYFFKEIGGDLSGIVISILAALVPTALLIAETYMLSQTKFDIYAAEELLAKIDKI